MIVYGDKAESLEMSLEMQSLETRVWRHDPPEQTTWDLVPRKENLGDVVPRDPVSRDLAQLYLQNPLR